MITDGVTDPADGHAVRTGDLIPQIAVDDANGNLYVVWQDDRFTGEEQIAFSRSTNGGRSWSATRRISTVGGVNQAFTPTVRVADNGTVAVQHYDFRFDDPTTTPPLTTDVWLLRSANGGASWTEERIGSGTPGVVIPGNGTGSFDMTTAPDALGYFVGDYAGLDFAGSGSRPGFKPFHGPRQQRQPGQSHGRVRHHRVNQRSVDGEAPCRLPGRQGVHRLERVPGRIPADAYLFGAPKPSRYGPGDTKGLRNAGLTECPRQESNLEPSD